MSRSVAEIGKYRALCEDGHFAGLCEALSLQASQLRATRHFSENAEAVGKLKTLAHLFERRFYDAIVDSILAALQASRLISDYLWGVAAICLAVMMTGFAVFELRYPPPGSDDRAGHGGRGQRIAAGPASWTRPWSGPCMTWPTPWVKALWWNSWKRRRCAAIWK
ncbi:MAG: hypothetical protein VB101_13710 [Rhodospirillaceae bacterium]|nr:hypothetical protein [Rhodospirillaceae bacterium]